MNKRISKWFLTFLLAAVFAFCLPLGVLAEGAATEPDQEDDAISTQDSSSIYVSIDGVNLYNSQGATGKTVKGASYDRASNTLTLDNYNAQTVLGDTYTGDYFGISYVGNESFTLKLIGENTLNCDATQAQRPNRICGIFNNSLNGGNSDLSISGPGTLDINLISPSSGTWGILKNSPSGILNISDCILNINTSGAGSAAICSYDKINFTNTNVKINSTITTDQNDFGYNLGVCSWSDYTINLINSNINVNLYNTNNVVPRYHSCGVSGYIKMADSNIIVQNYTNQYGIITIDDINSDENVYYYGGENGPSSQLSADQFFTSGDFKFSNHKYSQITAKPGSVTPTPTPQNIPVTGITLSQTDVTLKKGETIPITATVSPDNATNKDVVWIIGSTSVATYSNGVIKATGAGTSYIRCTAKDGSGVYADCKVTVTEKKITSLAMANAPTKTTYTVADKLDVSGGKLNVTYDDGSTDSVALTDAMCSGYDPTRIGTQTVTVTYEGKTTSFNVTVNAKSDGPSVLYQTHIQNIGWNQGWKIDGDEAGTHGQSLRLEAIQVKLSNAKVSGSVQYKTHIQNKGWETNWSSDGAVSGTSGQGLRLEAIQIQLTGEIANQYDIYYRVHAQNFGWLGWAKNGESAGTAGYAYRLEAIQIQLVKKGGAAPGSTDNAFKQPLVSYQTHVQNVGWQNYVNDGAVSGTEGQSLRLEGIKVNLASQPFTGSIQYKTHIQNLGWETSWHANGDMSGTQGQSLRLEAIQIQLTGEMADHYDMYYRVHAQNFGDLGWAKNGESAGTAGYGYRLEAIQIQLVTKGGAAPGSTDQAFVQR